MARDATPPTLTLSAAVESGALRVTWSSSDAASGVDAGACTLEVQEDEGAWQPFSTDCAGDEVHTAAQSGHVYTFRFSATDNVSNGATAEALARFPRVTKYYYHGGRRVAMRRGGVVYYLHGDHLGSVSLVTEAGGNVHSRQLFLPYGDLRYAIGASPTDFGFAGQRRVPGTGLVFMHARYYHPALARFVSADTVVPNTLNPQLLNRYSYAGNNPVLYNDPDGHCGPLCIVGLIAAGVALLVMTSDVAPPPDSPVAHSRTGNQRVGETALWVAGSFGAGILAAPEVSGPVTAKTAAELAAAGACADGDCTNEARDAAGFVSRFVQSDAARLERFANEARVVQGERGMESFGGTWRLWGELASESEDIANNLFTYRVGDRIMGAMKIANGTSALKIMDLEGLGGGAGTALVRTAVQESINRGYGGQISLFAAGQAAPFYEKLGFVLANPATNEYFLSAEAALMLLQSP